MDVPVQGVGERAMPSPRGLGRARALKLGMCLGAPLLILVFLTWGGYLSRIVDTPVIAREGPPLPTSAGEMDTTGDPMMALGAPPFGTIGLVLQFAVVLACPALERLERRPRKERGDASIEDGDAGATRAGRLAGRTKAG